MPSDAYDVAVVGAVGRHSKVADLAGLPGKELPNQRFGYFAAYRNVVVKNNSPGQIWLLQPNVAYAFNNEDGITVLASMPDKQRIDDFADDREAALLRMFADLPERPDISAAERVSDIVGTRDYPSIVRKKFVAPGVALIGDAAMVGGPWVADRFWQYGTRNASPLSLFNPRLLVRAYRARSKSAAVPAGAD